MKAGIGETRDFRYYLAAAVSFLTFLVYLPALQNNFVGWDDGMYVVDNPHIRSLDSVFFKWAFFDFYAANWHPLTWISHALDYAVWGLNPMGHHLTNNILHAVNTFLVVLLVVRLVGAGHAWGGRAQDPPLQFSSRFTVHDSRFALIAAATTGLLFGLHPVHVESVAWVAERKDLLCALFYLLSVMMYMRYSCDASPSFPLVGNPSGMALNKGKDPGQAGMTEPGLRFLSKYYLFSLCFFILALLSKPMAVSLPLVLLILDWYPFQRITSFKTFRISFVEKIPFIALSLVSSVLTIMAQKTGDAMELTEFVPLSTRLLVASKSLFAYVWKMVLPLKLLPYYPYPRTISLVSLDYLSAIAFVLGISVVFLVVMKKHKLMLSAWFYYLLTLAPVLGIIQVGHQSMADRYTYLPCLELFLIVGMLAAWALENVNFLLRLAAGVMIVLLLSLLAYRTIEQIHIWKNGLTLWTYVIKEEPTQASAYYYRGVTLEETWQFDKAARDYEMALTLNPWHYGAYNNRGVLYGKDGLFDKAIEYFNRSVEINPNYSLAYGNRGYTYFLRGQNDRAIEDFSKAIDLDYNYAKAYVNRGNLYLQAGKREYAFPDFQKACNLGDKEGCDALYDR